MTTSSLKIKPLITETGVKARLVHEMYEGLARRKPRSKRAQMGTISPLDRQGRGIGSRSSD